jgi:hypothetical protein
LALVLLTLASPFYSRAIRQLPLTAGAARAKAMLGR